MSRKAMWVALSVVLCVFLLALHSLRSDETASEQIPAMSMEGTKARDGSDRERMADGAQGGTPRPAEHGKPDEPGTQSSVSLPAPMAQAIESVSGPRQPASAALESERAFAAEPADPGWARAMEARITGEIGSVFRGGLVTMQVECKTSTCRILLAQQVHVDPKQPTAAVLPLYDELFKRLGYAPRPVQFAIDRSGVATSLVYLPDLRASSDGNPTGSAARAGEVRP